MAGLSYRAGPKERDKNFAFVCLTLPAQKKKDPTRFALPGELIRRSSAWVALTTRQAKKFSA